MKTRNLFAAQFWTLFFLLTSISLLQGQSWQQSLRQSNEDFRDYSVAQSLDNPDRIVLAGTLEDQTTGNTSIHLVGFDVNTGAITFEKTYLSSADARAFHITAFDSGTDIGFAVSGSLESGGFRKALILLVDETGNLLNSATYDLEPSGEHSQGLHMVATPADPLQGFMMVGYVNQQDPSGDLRFHPKQAFALKVEQNLSTQWARLLDRPYNMTVLDYDGASHVEITDHGYFITGGKNTLFFLQRQGILAVMLDFNGNLVWDQSYFGGNAFDAGASAYYDQPNDEIYLLTNYSNAHHFGMTVLDAATGAIDQSRSFITANLDLDKYGFSLQPSPKAGHLWITGHGRDEFWTGTAFERGGPAFIVEYDMVGEKLVVNHLENHLSMPYPDLTDDFAPFQSQMPYYFYPEISATLGGRGGVYLSYQGATAADDLELVVTKLDYWEQFLFCDADTLELDKNPLVLNPTNIVDSIEINPVSVSPQTAAFNPSDDLSEVEEMCFLVSQQEVEIPASNWSVFPNPARHQIQVQAPQDLPWDAEVSWTLYASTGQVLQTSTVLNPIFPLDGYPAGMYLVQMEMDGRVVGGKKVVVVE